MRAIWKGKHQFRARFHSGFRCSALRAETSFLSPTTSISKDMR